MLPVWSEKLAEAGRKYDGHVTHGSHIEQVKVMKEQIKQMIDRLHLIGDQCLAGGHKSRSRMFHAIARSFEVRYL
jgi:hypothetical protein